MNAIQVTNENKGQIIKVKKNDSSEWELAILLRFDTLNGLPYCLCQHGINGVGTKYFEIAKPYLTDDILSLKEKLLLVDFLELKSGHDTTN